MIYFVDEDVMQIETFKIELILMGYEVNNLLDADEAFNVLSKADAKLELAIIDVMLAADIDSERSKYNRDRTEDYLKTGLCLLDDLKNARPDIFPRKAVLFSMASDLQLLQTIRKISMDYGIPFFDKNKFTSAINFGTTIDNYIKKLG